MDSEWMDRMGQSEFDKQLQAPSILERLLEQLGSGLIQKLIGPKKTAQPPVQQGILLPGAKSKKKPSTISGLLQMLAGSPDVQE